MPRHAVHVLLTACLAVTFGCDLDASMCVDDPVCDSSPAEGDPDQAPREPDAGPPPPPEAMCDADVLDGLSCDCGGLRIDVVTLSGEIVSDGKSSVVLREGGTGAFENFGVCRDYYGWEHQGPTCSLVLIRTDAGCGGLALQHPLGAGDSTDCPYVSETDLATVCTEVVENEVASPGG